MFHHQLLQSTTDKRSDSGHASSSDDSSKDTSSLAEQSPPAPDITSNVQNFTKNNVGNVSTDPNERIGQLRQDQFAYEDYRVLDAVIMGHEKLWHLMQERGCRARP